VSLALFRALVDEFSAVADATVEIFIAQAALRMDSGIWGNVYSQANVYLAAHMMKLSPSYGGGSSAAGGALTSQRDGDLARNYAAPPTTSSLSDAYLLRTAYGAEFLYLRNSRSETGPMVVSVGSI
jgi:hypothetical protein